MESKIMIEDTQMNWGRNSMVVSDYVKLKINTSGN